MFCVKATVSHLSLIAVPSSCIHTINNVEMLLDNHAIMKMKASYVNPTSPLHITLWNRVMWISISALLIAVPGSCFHMVNNAQMLIDSQCIMKKKFILREPNISITHCSVEQGHWVQIYVFHILPTFTQSIMHIC